MTKTDLTKTHSRLMSLFDSGEMLKEKSALSFWTKDYGEYVSNLDLQIDRYLRALLPKVLDVPVLSEERAILAPLPDTYWLVDPLDGTRNRLAALPPTAISIALMIDGLPAVALVSELENGRTKSTFIGAGDKSSHLFADSKIRLQPLVGLSTGIIRKAMGDSRWQKFVESVTDIGRIRITGSQSMQGLWVSEGKLQMSFSYESKAWDDCAAGLLVTESGGVWSCFTETHTGKILPDARTSSSFVSRDYKRQASVAEGLFKTALMNEENLTHRSIGKVGV